MTFSPSAYRPLVTGGHRQTLYAWARRRRFPRLPEPEPRYFDVAEDARVLAHCHWQAERARRPALILLHGLEGSSHAHYMAGISDKAWAAGWNVVRLNQRNCGNTEHLSRGLYHSGLTHDALFVLHELIEREHIRSIAIAGYSLGGNLALKLAGDLGDAAPPELAAVCAVSPTMDLARCVDALERRSNFVYQWNFVRNLKARMRRKAAAFPGAFSLEPLRRVWTVRGFDEAYTAPHHGFRDAADYYERASALRVIGRIRVPTLIITAKDDPFVPDAPFRGPEVAGNPHITLVITPNGGHCAYLERPSGEYDGYWAEREILRFAQHTLDHRPSMPSAVIRVRANSGPFPDSSCLK
jgi:predicted alpha/beta-fold hydrolase